MIGRLWYWGVHGFCRVLLAVLFRFRAYDFQQIPDTGPVLLLSNHQGHLDPVLVGVGSRRQLRFLARATLFAGPFAWLIRSLGAVPIDREGSGLAGLRTTLKILKAGDALLMFPEGTRTRDGKLQPLKPGFCALAKRTQATLVPVGIAGSYEALPRDREWPHFRPIALAFGKALTHAEIEPLSDDELVELVYQGMAHAQRRAAEEVGLEPAAPEVAPQDD